MTDSLNPQERCAKCGSATREDELGCATCVAAWKETKMLRLNYDLEMYAPESGPSRKPEWIVVAAMVTAVLAIAIAALAKGVW